MSDEPLETEARPIEDPQAPSPEVPETPEDEGTNPGSSVREGRRAPSDATLLTRAGEHRLELVPLSDLQRAPRNPKDHDIGGIADSLDRFGFVAPVLIDETTGSLVAGHGRLETLQERKAQGLPPPARILVSETGDWLVPVVRGIEFADATEAEAYLLADNRLAEIGGWKDQDLAPMLANLAEKDSLVGTGFSDTDLRELLERLDVTPEPAPDERDPDVIPSLPAKIRTKRGDVWQLGPHRIMCGDCREAGDVEKLLAGTLVNVAVTSPPYADRRKYDETSGFEPIHPNAYVEWFEAVQDNVAAHLAEDGSWFVNIKAGAKDLDRETYVLDLVLAHVRRWGWHFAEEFCWERGGVPKAVRRRFKNQFEPIYQFALGEWKMRPEAVMHPSDNVPVTHPGNGIYGHPENWQGQPREGFTGTASSVQGTHGALDGQKVVSGMAYPGNRLPTFTGSHEALGHTAAFPVGLPEFFVRAYSDEGDAIFDPFLGSGSTIIAAERTSRIGFGMELSPGYVDVSVKRWEDFTGGHAERVRQ